MQIKSIFNSALNVIRDKKMAKIFAVVFMFAIFPGCTSTSPPPPVTGSSSKIIKKGVVGGSIVNIVELSAKVTDIDPVNRKVTLLMPDGNKNTVTVGPEAVNFDQVQEGDIVKVSLTEELVVGLLNEHAALPDGKAAKSLGYIETDKVPPAPDGTTGIVALAMKGSQPGGLLARTKQVTATVSAIDLLKRTATLSLKDGTTKTFQVRDDIDLSQRKVGEKVVFHLTEMVAIEVEKQ